MVESVNRMETELIRLETRVKESEAYGEITEGTVEALNKSWYEYQETRRQMDECQNDISDLEQKKAELDRRLEQLRPLRERVDRMGGLLKEQEREAAAAKDMGRKPGPAIPLFVPMLFFIAAVLVLVVPGLLGHNIGIPLLAAAVVSALAGVITVLLRGMKKKHIPVSQAEIQLAMLREEGFSGLSDYLSQKNRSGTLFRNLTHAAVSWMTRVKGCPACLIRIARCLGPLDHTWPDSGLLRTIRT